MSSDPLLPPGLEVFERGWLSSNNILVSGRHGTALIDSGYASHSAQTVALVETALGQRSLDRLLNTHLHSDHCGGNAALQKRYPAMTTSIPPGLARHVKQWDPVALSYAPTGQRCERFHFDDLLRPGTEELLGNSTWEIHAAPGHDPHSVVLFEPEHRVLLSADALWENGFGIIFPELEGKEAFAETAQTLDLIERLGARTVIPGHGRVFTTIPQALKTARQRLEYFASAPIKHARHAAKVLLKFKLLETQQATKAHLLQWAEASAYFEVLHQRYFLQTEKTAWLNELLAELISSGAARNEGELILN